MVKFKGMNNKKNNLKKILKLLMPLLVAAGFLTTAEEKAQQKRIDEINQKMAQKDEYPKNIYYATESSEFARLTNDMPLRDLLIIKKRRLALMNILQRAGYTKTQISQILTDYYTSIQMQRQALIYKQKEAAFVKEAVKQQSIKQRQIIAAKVIGQKRAQMKRKHMALGSASLQKQMTQQQFIQKQQTLRGRIEARKADMMKTPLSLRQIALQKSGRQSIKSDRLQVMRKPALAHRPILMLSLMRGRSR